MLNQYSQEMPVTEIPSDQLGHIATCDGWSLRDRMEALAELKRRQTQLEPIVPERYLPVAGDNCLFNGTGDKPCRRCMDCQDHYS